MHGLFRVREFTQDDAHIFCTQEQVKDVIIDVLEFVDSLMKHYSISNMKWKFQQNLKKQSVMTNSGK